MRAFFLALVTTTSMLFAAPAVAAPLAPADDPTWGTSRPAVPDAAVEMPHSAGAGTAAGTRYIGAAPLNDILYWADQRKACGLTRDQLAAMMLAPIYPETGAGTTLTPSPMTLSRWDTQSGLYAFGNPSGPYPRAFFHPGIGMWQFDSAGGWPLTAAGAINTSSSGQQAATVMSQRWCQNQTRSYAWGPWYGCATTSLCEDIYNTIFDGTALVNLTTDPNVGSDGGAQYRTCNVLTLGSGLSCVYVDPSKAQGGNGWAQPGAGPAPITAPFYVFALNGIEYRYWLAADTGYGATIVASKPVTANARTSLTWAMRDDLCDLTYQRGACDRNPFGRLDTAAGGAGSANVRGWAIDPDTNAAIVVHTYIDGTFMGPATAADPRGDIGAAYPLFGPNHGFSVTFPNVGPGAHTACVYAMNSGAGSVNMLLGCQSFTMLGGSPLGSLDTVAAGAGSLLVRGWALDPDVTTAVDVHVHVDGVPIGLTVASTARADVAAAFPLFGANHGFDATFPGIAAGAHTVCVYAINVGTGANTQLRCSGVTVQSGNPFGAVDSAASAFGSVTLSGWAIDPDTTGSATVHVYADGVFTAPVAADTSRTDVGAAFALYGANHGFSATISPIGGGAHTLCAYAMNSGPGSMNMFLGCRTVVASGTPIGFLDAASAAPAAATLRGWAIDPDTTGTVTVDVRIDGQPLGSGTADGMRGDLAAGFPAYGGAHGFEFALSGVGGGAHQICAFARNVAVGTDAALGCRVIQSSGDPLGSVDVASASSIAGWALDPDSFGSTTIHVYVDGIGTVIASTGNPRPDVAAAFPAFGPNRGFLVPLTLAPGPHNVCAYAINVASGSVNTLLGCRSV